MGDSGFRYADEGTISAYLFTVKEMAIVEEVSEELAEKVFSFSFEIFDEIALELIFFLIIFFYYLVFFA